MRPSRDRPGLGAAARGVLAGRGGAVAAPNDPANPGQPHQPGHLVPTHIQAGVTGATIELAGPIDAPVLPMQGDQRVGQVGILELGVGDRPQPALVVGGGRDLHPVLAQHGADRLDAEPVPVGLDVVDDHLSRRSSSA